MARRALVTGATGFVAGAGQPPPDRRDPLRAGAATHAGVARPPVEGLSTPTTVTDSSGAELFNIHPTPFMDALRKALDEDHRAPARAG